MHPIPSWRQRGRTQTARGNKSSACARITSFHCKQSLVPGLTPVPKPWQNFCITEHTICSFHFVLPEKHLISAKLTEHREEGCKEGHHHPAGQDKRQTPLALGLGAEHHLVKRTVLTHPPAQRPGPGGLQLQYVCESVTRSFQL